MSTLTPRIHAIRFRAVDGETTRATTPADQQPTITVNFQPSATSSNATSGKPTTGRVTATSATVATLTSTDTERVYFYQAATCVRDKSALPHLDLFVPVNCHRLAVDVDVEVAEVATADVDGRNVDAVDKRAIDRVAQLRFMNAAKTTMMTTMDATNGQSLGDGGCIAVLPATAASTVASGTCTSSVIRWTWRYAWPQSETTSMTSTLATTSLDASSQMLDLNKDLPVPPHSGVNDDAGSVESFDFEDEALARWPNTLLVCERRIMCLLCAML